MQGRLTRTDRRLLSGASLLALILIVGMATVGGGLQGEESPIPSSYSGDSEGALGAYLLLRELGYSVQRWEQAPQLLPPEAEVLIVAEPTQLPGQGEDGALREFVERGGRVLFCGALLQMFFPAPPLQPVRASDWIEYRAELPSHFTRGAGEIVLRPAASWRFLTPSQVRLYGEGDGAAVVSWRVGGGEVLWWASSTPLTNAGITRGGNLQLFLNALAAESGEPLTIYWDEYFHGRHGSLWSYVRETPVRWALVQGGFLAVAAIFSFSRRSGPIAPPQAVSRLSPLEFVETMGGLYQRAGAASIAVDTSYRHLRLELARRLRLPTDSNNAALARAATDRLAFPPELDDTLQAAERTRLRAKLPGKTALDLVQRLEGYVKRLQALNARSISPKRN